MEFDIGQKVFLAIPVPYLKTAEPMPMLRPSDLVSHDEVGEVVGLHPNQTMAVRFRRGTFLIPKDNLKEKT